jgi:hypothetical protein
MFKDSRITIFLGVIALFAVVTFQLMNSISTSASPIWNEIGPGKNLTFNDQPLEERELVFQLSSGPENVKVIVINGIIVSSEAEIKYNKDKSKIIYILGDEGLWISNADGSEIRNIAHNGKDEFVKRIESFLETDDESHHGSSRWWVNQPSWIGNDKIAFVSNRDVFPQQWYTSVWVSDINGITIKKIIDGVDKQEDLNLLFSDEASVIAYGGINKTIFKYNAAKDSVDSWNLNGVPFSVSNNGKYIAFHQLDNQATMKADISILNMENGQIEVVKEQESLQSSTGAWSPNNQSFVFFSTEISTGVTKLKVLDMGRLSMNEVQKPANIQENINPVGVLSWADNRNITISTNNNKSYLVTIR